MSSGSEAKGKLSVMLHIAALGLLVGLNPITTLATVCVGVIGGVIVASQEAR